MDLFEIEPPEGGGPREKVNWWIIILIFCTVGPIVWFLVRFIFVLAGGKL